jgi:UDP-glucose 4-epimerase
MFSDEGWLQTASMRYFNVFGPRQDPGSAYAAAIPIFIHKAIRNEPLTIFGDGEQTRDFIFVKDIVAANVYLAENADLAGTFNVAYGKRQTINDIAKKIIQLTNSTAQIQYAAPRAGDVKHSQASIDKITETGFTSSANFEDGLAKTIEYFSRKFHQ